MKNFKFDIQFFANTFDIQFFADGDTPTTQDVPAAENDIESKDLEPGISIDFATHLSENINNLQTLLGIESLDPMAVGSIIKMYKMEVGELAEQVGENKEIGLTKVTRKLVNTIELEVKKYRKLTSFEAIQKVGQNTAVNQTDAKVISKIQKGIKADFLANLAKGTGTASGNGLQATLAAAWGKVVKFFEDMDATPIFFVSSDDVAEYLGSAQLTVQNTFGFNYIKNFLGLGDALIVPSLTAGTLYATSKENLRGAYIPATGSEAGDAFGLTGDETGLIGITHTALTSSASIETLMVSGVVFYPEYTDGVIKATVNKA